VRIFPPQLVENFRANPGAKVRFRSAQETSLYSLIAQGA
jgi:hypothetical protein